MKLALNIGRLICCVLMGFGFSAAITADAEVFKFFIGCTSFWIGLMGYIDIRITQSRENHI